jgi:hypothetical protein
MVLTPPNVLHSCSCGLPGNQAALVASSSGRRFDRQAQQVQPRTRAQLNITCMHTLYTHAHNGALIYPSTWLCLHAKHVHKHMCTHPVRHTGPALRTCLVHYTPVGTYTVDLEDYQSNKSMLHL